MRKSANHTALSQDELIRQARNRYAREYRRKNPEKIKEYNRRYWLKLAEKALTQDDTEL